jgi:hypothetical protein
VAPPDPLLARVRNLVRSLGTSPAESATILRVVAAELAPDIDADARLRSEAEWWRSALTAEGFTVTPDSMVGTAAAARVLDCHEVTLRKQRGDPNAPPHSIVNGRARYSLPELLAYCRERSPA